MHTKITSKGQIVIPASLRQKYHIDKGTTFHIADDGGKIILTPITDEHIKNLKGILKPKKSNKTALQILEEERKKVRLAEDETFNI